MLKVLHSWVFPIFLLAAAAFVVYAPSLGNDFVAWDDDLLVYENPLVQQLTPGTVAGAFMSYDPELYVPLTIMSFQVEHALVGFNPFFFHLDNLLLHIIMAALVLLLLERLGLDWRISFTGALIFAVHPLNTEAVAWVSARKDLLCAVFSLGSALAYLRYRLENVRLWLGVSLALFLCALLSKPLAIVLPAALVLLDWKEWGNVGRKQLAALVPFFALSAVFLVIGLYGKEANITALTSWETVLLAAKSTAFSLWKFVWPSGLSPIYLQTTPVALLRSDFLVPVALMMVLAALTVWALRRSYRSVAFATLWFVLFLLPSFSNFSKNGDIYFFSDRYIYLSQIGLLFLLGLGLSRLLRNASDHRRTIVMVVIMLVSGVSLGIAAHAASRTWQDSETFYRHALEGSDRSVSIRYNLALLQQGRGELDAAVSGYEKVLEFDPDNMKTLNNLANLYGREGQGKKALEYADRAIQSDPQAAQPHNTKGSILMDAGDIDTAIVEFWAAIELQEKFAQAHINLADALGKKGLYEEGIREYKRAFELAPQLLDGLPEIREMLEKIE